MNSQTMEDGRLPEGITGVEGCNSSCAAGQRRACAVRGCGGLNRDPAGRIYGVWRRHVPSRPLEEADTSCTIFLDLMGDQLPSSLNWISSQSTQLLRISINSLPAGQDTNTHTQKSSTV